MTKPIVLHIGDPIKYNHKFFEEEFLFRFDVVRSDDSDRTSFINSLKAKKHAADHR